MLSTGFHLSSLVRAVVQLKAGRFFAVHMWHTGRLHLLLARVATEGMPHLSPQQKQSILTHYRSRRTGETASSIAALHDVKGGRATILGWWHRWDGTVQSLERKKGSGRPRALSRAQVTRHVRMPIRNSNRAARQVRYPKLLPQVRAATASRLSLRTLQRYGKEEAGGHSTRGRRRTAAECKYAHTIALPVARLHPA